MFFTKTAPAFASNPASLLTSNPRDESDQVEVSVPVAAQQNSFQTTLTLSTPQLMARDATIQMEYENRTSTLFVLIKCQHEAFVW